VGEIRSDGSVRVYVYVDELALAPFLYVDYANLDAEPGSGKVKYLFTNHLGAPERIEDESGRTIWRGEVSPYGAVHVEVGCVDEINLRFPGHYYDAETGLHYNRFRYYDPALGCYLQSDPLGIVGGLNLQAYLANPLTDVDILGLSTRHGRGGGRPKGEGGSQGPIKPARQRAPRAPNPLRPSRRSPAKWSDARLQRAVDEIHYAEYGGSYFGTKNPITVSVTPGGRVVVSQVGGLPGRHARARADEIFKGHKVEYVGGGESANPPHGVDNHHSEARGIHHLGEDAQGTRQASSHYACPSCEGRQNTAGVNNTTGAASEHGGKITRDYTWE
jgi:RHS repeat-associated protein